MLKRLRLEVNIIMAETHIYIVRVMLVSLIHKVDYFVV